MGSSALMQLSGTTPEVFPEEAISELIDDMKKEPKLEEKILDVVREERQKREPDIILFWVILALGETGSETAAEVLFDCLSGSDLYLVHEFAEYALTQLEETGLETIFNRFEGEPSWEARLSSYSIIEETVEYGDADLKGEAIEFLKERAHAERNSNSNKDLTEEVLWALSGFDNPEVDSFILEVMDDLPETNETQGIRKVIEGKKDYSDQRHYQTPWQEYGRNRLT